MDLSGAGLPQEMIVCLLVVPRTIESSTRMTRFPRTVGDRIELDVDAHPAHGFGRLGERPAHVTVFRQRDIIRDPRPFSIPEGGRGGRVGRRDDHVRFDRGFPGEAAADLFTHFVDALAGDDAVGPGKVDKLEDAKRLAAPTANCSERSPCSSMTTISPGRTSRTSSAPTVSKAHDSDARNQASSVRPIESGRMPMGSLKPIRRSWVIAQTANAPVNSPRRPPGRLFEGDIGLDREEVEDHFAVRRRLKCESAFKSSTRSRLALVRLPLCASATWPCREKDINGWALATWAVLVVA